MPKYIIGILVMLHEKWEQSHLKTLLWINIHSDCIATFNDIGFANALGGYRNPNQQFVFVFGFCLIFDVCRSPLYITRIVIAVSVDGLMRQSKITFIVKNKLKISEFWTQRTAFGSCESSSISIAIWNSNSFSAANRSLCLSLIAYTHNLPKY